MNQFLYLINIINTGLIVNLKQNIYSIFQLMVIVARFRYNFINSYNVNFDIVVKFSNTQGVDL